MIMNSDIKKKKIKPVSYVLSILLFILTCVFTGMLMIRAGNATVIIRYNDFLEFIEETEYAYYIVNTLNGFPFNEAYIDFETVEEFLNTEAVSNEINSVIDMYAEALARGDLDFHLSSDDVFYIVLNLEPEISELFDHQMTIEDSDNLTRMIDDILGFDSLSVGGILEDFGLGTTLPFLFVSPYVLIFVGVLCFAIIMILFWINKNAIAGVFPAVGIPVMLSGLLFLILWLMIDRYPQLLGEAFSWYASLTGGIAFLAMRYGTITLIAGFVFSLLYFVFKPRIVKGKRVIKRSRVTKRT